MPVAHACCESGALTHLAAGVESIDVDQGEGAGFP